MGVLVLVRQHVKVMVLQIFDASTLRNKENIGPFWQVDLWVTSEVQWLLKLRPSYVGGSLIGAKTMYQTVTWFNERKAMNLFYQLLCSPGPTFSPLGTGV